MIKDDVRWLTKKAICNRLDVCSQTLTRKIKAGEFPASQKTYKRMALWSEVEVNEWLAENAEENLNIITE